MSAMVCTLRTRCKRPSGPPSPFQTPLDARRRIPASLLGCCPEPCLPPALGSEAGCAWGCSTPVPRGPYPRCTCLRLRSWATPRPSTPPRREGRGSSTVGGVISPRRSLASSWGRWGGEGGYTKSRAAHQSLDPAVQTHQAGQAPPAPSRGCPQTGNASIRLRPGAQSLTQPGPHSSSAHPPASSLGSPWALVASAQPEGPAGEALGWGYPESRADLGLPKKECGVWGSPRECGAVWGLGEVTGRPLPAPRKAQAHNPRAGPTHHTRAEGHGPRWRHTHLLPAIQAQPRQAQHIGQLGQCCLRRHVEA